MIDNYNFRKRWEDLNFSDNYIFVKVMENTDLCKTMLEILLNIEIDHVEHVRTESPIENFYDKKGIRLDVFIKDSTRIFDIEMQVGNYKDILLRARYYQGAMDVATTKRRTKYSDLKESYIIFICKDDPFGLGLPVYTKKCHFLETNKVPYNDKTNIVFYNASGYAMADSPKVRNVLQYIYNFKSESDFTDKLAESVIETKQQPVFVEEYMYFSDILEDTKEDALEEGMAKGIVKGKKAGIAETKKGIVLKMLEHNLPEEQIMACTDVTKKELEIIKEKAVLVER